MQPAVAGVMVRSQIVKANGELVNVDYYASQRRQLADLRRLPRQAQSAKWRPPLRVRCHPEEGGP